MEIMKLESVRAVKKRYEQMLLDIDGVVGVGVGLSSKGQPCIKAYVKAKIEELGGEIPNKLDGVQVVLEEIGDIIPY